jgi:uncharacterized protein
MPIDPRAEDATLAAWESRCREWLVGGGAAGGDPAHDLLHVERVVANARLLAASGGADPWVVLPAAWLHDCVHVPKGSPERPTASRRAADAAGAFLRTAGFPAEHVPAVEHAIEAHSFSGGVEPRTAEARVVRDADRLDALGAIGIARTLLLGGVLGTPLYDRTEPVPRRRVPDDRENVLDHLFVKLLRLAEGMLTVDGRREAARRTAFMRRYVNELEREIEGIAPPAGGAGEPAG